MVFNFKKKRTPKENKDFSDFSPEMQREIRRNRGIPPSTIKDKILDKTEKPDTPSGL